MAPKLLPQAKGIDLYFKVVLRTEDYVARLRDVVPSSWDVGVFVDHPARRFGWECDVICGPEDFVTAFNLLTSSPDVLGWQMIPFRGSSANAHAIHETNNGGNK